jgi:hypothetical protein
MTITLTLPKPPSCRKAPTVLLIFGPAQPGRYYVFEGDPQNGRELTPGTITFTLEHPGCLYQVSTRDNEAIIYVSKKGRYTVMTRAEANSYFNGTYKSPAVPKQWWPLADFAFPASWADEAEEV